MLSKHPYEISAEENIFISRRSGRISRPCFSPMQDTIDLLNDAYYCMNHQSEYLKAEETVRNQRKEDRDLNEFLYQHLHGD